MAAGAGAAEDSTEVYPASGVSSKKLCSASNQQHETILEMLGLDLSLLSGTPCRMATDDRQQPQEYSCEYVREPKQQPQQNIPTKASSSKGIPPSPAVTERTQVSFSSWVNNNTNSALLPNTNISSTDLLEVSSFGIEVPPPRKHHQDIHRVPSNGSGSNRRPMEIINLSSSFSSVGKSVLKNIRKNISLVASGSFDSGILKKKRKKACTIPREVMVKVVEGEGVEVSTKPTVCESEHDTTSSGISSTSSEVWIAEGGGVEVFAKSIYSEHETHCSNSNNTYYKSTKMARDASTFASTFATTSLTSGEESDNAEIYKDDADIRRLCDLMDKIRSSDNEKEKGELEDEKWVTGIHRSKSDSELLESDETLDLHRREKEAKVTEIVFETGKVSSLLEPREEPESMTDDIFDLMVFVNNEHKVLEYAPEEFEKLNRK